MTLDELRALLEVIEVGSISQAASRLGVPRTTLARRLEALEAGFGTPLLTVSRDGALPTEAGARLARGAEALLHQAAQLDVSVRFELETPTRPVQLVIPPGIAPIQLALGLQYWRQQFPGVLLRVRTQTNPFLHDADGHPDFIMSFGRPRQGDYRVFQLLRMRIAFRASAAYLQRHGTPTSIEALAEHALWVWDGALMSSSAGTSILLRDGTLHAVTPAVVLDDLHQLHVAAQRGVGLALVPSLPFAVPDIEPDEVEVLGGSLGGDFGLWAAVPERNVDLAWTRRLIAGLREFFAKLEAMAGQRGDS